MTYDEEVYEKLLKNFNLLCAIIRQNTSGNQMKADLTKIEKLMNSSLNPPFEMGDQAKPKRCLEY